MFRDAQTELAEIFSNIDDIYEIHKHIWNSMNKKLLPEVQAQLSNPLFRTFDVDGCCLRLANLFLSHTEKFKAYVEYTGNYNIAVNRLSLLQKSHHYNDFIAVNKKMNFRKLNFCFKLKKRLYNGLGLLDYLVKPLQSINKLLFSSFMC